ncbi:1-(5-phosphoribosyl)-5-[(5-phosphoribosylamino)methylideneamino]imidazole-4-carboxamide isomerase [Chryseosolibacter indicus]|uniref:1-(5-phosphoribosyl)-5-[(5-phosphoribosylamino)methylideneamino] imidazole-4-carboxamide isomerase n=1 Tax=Chryseosolibacter indicus TaxID=2782351 RepID=A0ABS5VUV9_9BACT|nr:1-(5-phosphoribosyl)-5-[(5-phosphoribosylamino)methylideneamino]imidazole-4-carboxamide isomerase [Chryseosolibacter indicus]MBT1704539.1 1-(5-phosphoribosyl)-5-[(5-phosphoribosylamino)methylideneamino]imidazole-4-carboxamide isomerase [Chryseosolibacter indicus]
MRIIPAIDIIDGKCVRLTQGDYQQKKIYNENPVEVAQSFEQAGLKYLHLVDLDGARAGRVTNWKVVEEISSKTKLIIDFGGGIKTDEEVKNLFDLGVAQVNLGSIAVKEPDKVISWSKKYGAEKLILGADVKDEIIAIHGWQEKSQLTIDDFISNFQKHQLNHITCTDISTDGTLKGPNIGLYQHLITNYSSIKLIASGGVGSFEDLQTLQSIGVFGVIIGKAIYEGKLNLKQLVTL